MPFANVYAYIVYCYVQKCINIKQFRYRRQILGIFGVGRREFWRSFYVRITKETLLRWLHLPFYYQMVQNSGLWYIIIIIQQEQKAFSHYFIYISNVRLYTEINVSCFHVPVSK